MAPNLTITACLITRDEERSLPDCLDRVKGLVDEIVVVDTGSRDRTCERARERGARVFHELWNEDFSAARNAALERARGDWILSIDADELVEWKDPRSFRDPLRVPGRWGCLFPLVNVHEDKTVPVLMLRLFRRHPQVRFSGIIHECIDDSLAEVAGDLQAAVGLHPARILHYGYLEARRREKRKDDRDLHLLRKQVRLAPRDPHAWYKLAVHPLLFRHKEAESREAIARAWAVLLDPEREGTSTAVALEVAALYILQRLHDNDLVGAGQVAERALRFPGESPNLYYALGRSFLVRGGLDEASRCLDQAISFHGRILPHAPFQGVTSYLAWNSRSELLYLQGDRAESLRIYDQVRGAVKEPPGNAFHGPLQALIERGSPSQALRLLEQILRKDPTDWLLWERGSRLLEALGLTAPASRWLDRARNGAQAVRAELPS